VNGWPFSSGDFGSTQWLPIIGTAVFGAIT